MRSLMRRSVAFRWLWARHDAVAAWLADPAGTKQRWIALADLARESGITVTRETMRATWRRVDAEWKDAPAELRAANIDPRKGRRPPAKLLAAMVGERVAAETLGESMQAEPIEEDDFELVSVKRQ